jgi:hypothetical protein
MFHRDYIVESRCGLITQLVFKLAQLPPFPSCTPRERNTTLP